MRWSVDWILAEPSESVFCTVSAIWVEGMGKKENMAVDVDWSEEEEASEAWKVFANISGSFGAGVAFGSGKG